MPDENNYDFAASVHVAAAPEHVYDVVSDVTRTGEWSPFCVRGEWDDGDGPRVGARFTGFNVKPGREWQTRNEVVVADRGRAFAWEGGGGLVRWGYEMVPDGDGTRLTETWEFRPAGREKLRGQFGDDAERQIAIRVADARTSIPETLAVIRTIVEG